MLSIYLQYIFALNEHIFFLIFQANFRTNHCEIEYMH